MPARPILPSVSDAFLANISHEIRTPLTAILGYTDLLASEIRDRELQEHLQIIRTNGRHLLRLLSDLLDLSQAEAGLLKPNPRRCSPQAVLEETTAAFRSDAHQKGLYLKLEFEGPLPESIQTDPDRVRQIVRHLIANAIKFTKAGGVTVRVRMGRAAESDETRLCVDVIDTGIGVSKEHWGALFQSFSKADNSVTRPHGGAGIGLALAERLTRLLGGVISAESVPGQGSRFTLAIDPGPLDGVRFKVVRSTPCDPSETEVHLPLRVLIVEDLRPTQKLIEHHFRHAGARTALADDGRAALVAVARANAVGDPFQLIVLDMHMPRMDGYETARSLRGSGCRIPIIALTARALVGDREKCLEAGCDDYCVKPIDPPRLLTVAARLTRFAGSSVRPAPAADDRLRA